MPLDREQSAQLSFNMSCTVSDGSSASSTWHQQVSVTLLDEDDNVPRLQSDLHVMHVYLNNNSLVEVSERLLEPMRTSTDASPVTGPSGAATGAAHLLRR